MATSIPTAAPILSVTSSVVWHTASSSWRSRDLIEQRWFGIGAAHPRLAQRVGHYTLLARENWAITDQILGEKKHRMVGVHGGTTADEMYVPLILAQA